MVRPAVSALQSPTERGGDGQKPEPDQPNAALGPWFRVELHTKKEPVAPAAGPQQQAGDQQVDDAGQCGPDPEQSRREVDADHYSSQSMKLPSSSVSRCSRM